MNADHPPRDPRQPEGQQAEPNEIFRMHFEGIADQAIVLVDAEGRVVCWSAGAQAAFGYQEAEVIGRDYSFLFTSQDVESGEPRKQLEAAGGDSGRFEGERLRARKGGSCFLADVVITAVRRGGGGPVAGFSQVTRDATRRDDERAGPTVPQGEALFRTAFEDTNLAMALTDAGHRFVRVNAAFARLFGYDVPGEMLGMSMAEVTHPDDVAESLARRAPLESGESDFFQMEKRYVHKDGGVFWGLANVSVVRDPQGRPHLYVGQVQDVTQRKRAEEANARYNERLRILRQIDLALIAGDQPAEIAAAALPLLRQMLGVNRAIVNLFDLDRGEVEWLAAAGRKRVRAGPGVRYGLVFMGDLEALRRGEPQTIDTRDLPPGPEVDALLASDVRSYAVVPMIARGELIGALSFGGDVPVTAEQVAVAREVATQFAIALTQARLHERVRRQAEDLETQVRDTRRMEEERDRFFDLSVDLLCVAGYDGRFRLLNRAWEATLGWPASEMTSRPYTDFVHPDDLAATLAEAERLTQGHATLSFENRYRCKDGSYRWLSWRASPDPDRQVIYGAARDVTERKRAEQKFRNVLEAAPDGMVIVDSQGRIALVNGQAERLFGYPREEMLGEPVEILMPQRYRGNHADHRARFIAAPGVRRMGAALDLRGRRKDGGEFPVEISLSPLDTDDGVLIVSAVRDVTEGRLLEEQLRQSQKMDAIGKLAGGVAHDFNNLLTIINGYGEIMLARLPADSPHREPIREIVAAGDRAAGLTRQLLAFTRQQVVTPTVLDLTEVIGAAEKWLRRLIGEDVTLRVASAPALWAVKVDAGQVEQVLLNLVVNARDAMPRGGTLTIRTGNVEAAGGGGDAAGAARPVAPGPPGRHVLVSVVDTGVGMDAATKARIFEPFFTTKGERGTGLGLSTVYGIVKQAGGHVEVESEPGRGTEFKLYFPVTQERPTGKSLSGMRPPPQGTETVLLVEDEESVRSLGRLVLQGCGYTILEAANGREALQVGGRFRDSIHLLVTDVVMPQMGGRELADQFLALHPETRVLYVSGYTDDDVLRHDVRHAEMAFLQKPFSTFALAQKVREVLDQ